MARSVKCLLYKHEALISAPPALMEKSGAVLCPCNPSVEWVETGRSLGACGVEVGWGGDGLPSTVRKHRNQQVQ